MKTLSYYGITLVPNIKELTFLRVKKISERAEEIRFECLYTFDYLGIPFAVVKDRDDTYLILECVNGYVAVQSRDIPIWTEWTKKKGNPTLEHYMKAFVARVTHFCKTKPLQTFVDDWTEFLKKHTITIDQQERTKELWLTSFLF